MKAFSLEWLGDRWLAVGGDGLRAATWTSVDGLTWTAGAPVDPIGSDDPNDMQGYWMTDVIEHAGRLVAVGWNRIGCCDGGRAVSWSSEDGVHWTFHDPTGTSFDAAYHFPHKLAHLPSGDLILMSSVGLGSGAMLWTSPDGVTWTEIEGTDWESEGVVDVAVAPQRLMAVGYSPFTDHADDPVRVYTASANARSWTRASDPPGAAQLSAVAYDSGSGRFVVGGADTEGRPAVWTSTDGQGWATTILHEGSGQVLEVDATDGLVVLSGSTWTGEYRDITGVTWASHDAITWSIHEIGGELGLRPGGLLVIQQIHDPETFLTSYEIWIGSVR